MAISMTTYDRAAANRPDRVTMQLATVFRDREPLIGRFILEDDNQSD